MDGVIRLEKYGKPAKLLVAAAQTLADGQQHPETTVEHLVAVVLREHGPALRAAGVDVGALGSFVEAELKRIRQTNDEGGATVSYALLRLINTVGDFAVDGPVTQQQLVSSLFEQVSWLADRGFQATRFSAPEPSAATTRGYDDSWWREILRERARACWARQPENLQRTAETDAFLDRLRLELRGSSRLPEVEIERTENGFELRRERAAIRVDHDRAKNEITVTVSSRAGQRVDRFRVRDRSGRFTRLSDDEPREIVAYLAARLDGLYDGK